MPKHNIFSLISGLILLPILTLGVNPKDQTSTPLFEDPIVYDEEVHYQIEDGEEFSGEHLELQATSPNKVIIHYRNNDGNNPKRRLYTWCSGVNGKENSDYTLVDDENMYFTFDLTLPENALYNGKAGLYFIVKLEGTWDGQSSDTYLDYADYQLVNNTLEIWCIPGEGSALEVHLSEEDTYYDKVLMARFLDDWKTIRCEATYFPESYELYAYEGRYLREGAPVQNTLKPYRLIKRAEVGKENCTYDPKSETYIFDIELATTAHINVLYVVETVYETYPDKKPEKYVSFEYLYDTPLFEEYYTYDGDDLGVTYSEEEVTFKLWSPCSSNVRLNLYINGTPEQVSSTLGNDDGRSFTMAYTHYGVWQASVSFKTLPTLLNWFYTYEVTNVNGTSEVVDPYAKGVGVNGMRGYVGPLDASDPEGWDELPLKWDQDEIYDLKRPSDLTIYEVHIRDLTIDETWVSNQNNERGTYLAFAEKGTTYTDPKSGKTVKTGFDHIEELGVNAIQILPFFDSDNDETNYSYNWGYNPTNYNALEGAYASSSSDIDNLGGLYDPIKRANEFKQLVLAYANNANHTRVIMDVVYNHVSSASNSNFNKIMPKYFFRMTDDGYYMNGSGCNNEIKTERKMVRKFIVDSVSYWAKEYKIKGFRFDLMELIDYQTMAAVQEALYQIDPDIVIYGEPWSLGYNGSTDGTGPTNRGTVYSKLYGHDGMNGVAAFNDSGRNALKGENTCGGNGYGFISQGTGDSSNKVNDVMNLFKGVINEGANPDQTINYASCHDNYTLFDQLNYHLHNGGLTNPPAEYEPSPLTVAQASLSVHAYIFASQGIAFMHGGEEIFRTKKEYDPSDTTDNYEMYGYTITHNSYNSSDATNAFEWDRKISIEYQGEDIDVSSYSEKFKEAVAIHSYFSRFAYGETENKVNTWSNEEGSVVAGQGEYYFVFLTNREGGAISFDNINQAELLFTSNPSEDGGITNNNGVGLSLTGLTCAIYKGNW